MSNVNDLADLEKLATVPRLAHLKKGDSGYGFNLHGDKNQPGQTISAVDKDSPAEVGGLREGDRVIEVNGTNVEERPHGDVVKLIKENPAETTLLVCDKDTLAYLKATNRQCTADMANLQTVIPPKEESSPPVIANGDATPETVQEKIEESAPATVEESTPPPEQVTKDEDEATAADTTPDEVKQLNSVLDEQEKPAEIPEQTDSKPAVEEPPAAEEPAKPANERDGLALRDMQAAREMAKQSSKRKAVKATGDFGGKVSQFSQM